MLISRLEDQTLGLSLNCKIEDYSTQCIGAWTVSPENMVHVVNLTPSHLASFPGLHPILRVVVGGRGSGHATEVYSLPRGTKGLMQL